MCYFQKNRRILPEEIDPGRINFNIISVELSNKKVKQSEVIEHYLNYDEKTYEVKLL